MINSLLIFVIACASCFLGPWFLGFLMLMLLAASAKTPLNPIVAGVIFFVVWLIFCTYVSHQNEGLLAHRMAMLFKLPNNNLGYIQGISALIGFILAVLAVWSANALRPFFWGQARRKRSG